MINKTYELKNILKDQKRMESKTHELKIYEKIRREWRTTPRN